MVCKFTILFMIAKTPKPPYYAVIFTSIRTAGDKNYSKTSEKMIALARQQIGFLGLESARETIGITVSYWESLEAIKNWKNNSAHQIARQKGKDLWYQSFKVRICKVENDYEFEL
ncbi:MAG: antibiotic biosynthesis monooxygenase [Flavobacteriales bacterium CG_4_9_14_0_2_um_filter_35_242]|nr:antibiotic biosynthesis monooxygenase [Zetaproteobacteria bacterium]NDK17464.1 antibiotic biosynthesis monooxygenase [Flavobacteriales bacterium]PIR13696.1 MAG: antibiotic biosynthesis monooxygenase [Flavobacteriales bacterium CG11_big_fil_rev_8_21_14_0_20_35_7]PIV17734.1 MAG: antibiotic biosynthesis monooxygenase [Flavobacteriales bacterium CG03_land_8_20_14_0_80_35_15]PIX07393.1 MAG: antibiotic biosynthesis monooxygenase [Flavobacteriales bacterium CG_4_8_14_3_um_filter_35_10]PJA06002.1 M